MAEHKVIRNSTAEFLIFQIEGKKEELRGKREELRAKREELRAEN